MDLLGGTHFSLDGVKLSANVSKEWSGTLAELKHKLDKLQEKLQRVMEEHAQADQHPQKDREPKLGSDGKEIQSNAVDNESVKMPSSHGVVQGYNAQALVDSKHQVILAVEEDEVYEHRIRVRRLWKHMAVKNKFLEYH